MKIENKVFKIEASHDDRFVSCQRLVRYVYNLLLHVNSRLSKSLKKSRIDRNNP